tara:strand:+ start:956 stop:1819 length:864 start_codon:yes stop_codon:yes gene_type:complete
MKLNKKLKLGIVGYGFVGKATDWGFSKNIDKFIVDPILGTSVKDLSKFNPDIIFISVPTPMGKDGSQDSKIIESVMLELKEQCSESIKVVKSTVLPSILEKLEIIDNKIIYNPEFLREKHANEDFLSSEIIIFGGDRNTAKIVSKAYLAHSKCKNKDHIFTDLKSASLIKYSINSFLATKVLFFNELHSIYEKLNVKDEWKDIVKIISKDKRIGLSHMDVPGHDGKKGFGGACFPKDSYALVKYAEKVNVDMTTLKTVIDSNNKIRSSYSSLDVREFEQNVSFDDKI